MVVASEQRLHQTKILPRKRTTGSIHDYLFCYCPLLGILFEVLRIYKRQPTYRLGDNDDSLLVEPWTKLNRALSKSTPFLWNSLPIDIHRSQNVAYFMERFKTYIFNRTFTPMPTTFAISSFFSYIKKIPFYSYCTRCSHMLLLLNSLWNGCTLLWVYTLLFVITFWVFSICTFTGITPLSFYTNHTL